MKQKKMRVLIRWLLPTIVISVLLFTEGCSKPAGGKQETVNIESLRETEETPKESQTPPPETKEPPLTTEETEEGSGVQQKIVIATDIHYLAKELSGNRCKSFRDAVNDSDGRVLQYGWEVLDAFLDDMLEEKPDLIVLSGDLTFNGEKKSHEELAGKLEVLLDADIPVIVIPGNHDINNPAARRFTEDGVTDVQRITAEEFAEIYSDFGYVAADSRDGSSLSYLYKIDDYYELLMLDSCEYNPVNQVGGMIKDGTYEWMEEQLENAWEGGTQVITVSHHNLLDQSGVSPDFYDNCTIEHNEELIQVLSDWQVRLHLSGHLHLQHYMEDESGIYEIVTGSLGMAPCRYGILRIMEDGTYQYDGKQVDVDGWAKRHDYKNQDLADFKKFSENYLRQVTYQKAVSDLQKHVLNKEVFFSDEKIADMAKFYSDLCVYYYGGRMYEIADSVKKDKAYEYWSSIDYVSELSDFLRNILEDEAKDFAHLRIPY